jgi:hypothetical protein
MNIYIPEDSRYVAFEGLKAIYEAKSKGHSPIRFECGSLFCERLLEEGKKIASWKTPEGESPTPDHDRKIRVFCGVPAFESDQVQPSECRLIAE